MWKYLKYFVPAFFFAIMVGAAYLLGSSDSEELKNFAAITFMLNPLLSVYWYFYFTKKDYKYSFFIGAALFSGLLPYLLKALHLIDLEFINTYFWGKRMGLWGFTAGASIASIFYVLRFYKKPKQDIFSTIKLLLVLLATILLMVNMLIIEDEKINFFSLITVVILLAILSIIHIVDMIIWERAYDKNLSDLGSLDNLIDEISGK